MGSDIAVKEEPGSTEGKYQIEDLLEEGPAEFRDRLTNSALQGKRTLDFVDSRKFKTEATTAATATAETSATRDSETMEDG